MDYLLKPFDDERFEQTMEHVSRRLVEARAATVQGSLRALMDEIGSPPEALRRFALDTVMFPIYPRVWGAPRYRAAAEALLSRCQERDVGAMAIKACAREPWSDASVTHTTWYAPQTLITSSPRSRRDPPVCCVRRG